MKKANKILMASVAILLSLVLITTSVVSGVFAKFAIKKNTTTTMKLEKFGVTMEVLDPTNYAKIDTSKTVNDGQNVSVTFNNLIMQPRDGETPGSTNTGFSTSGYLQIKFSGTPTVITNLKVWVDIELSEKFYVPASAFPDASEYQNKAFMPIQLYTKSFLNGTAVSGASTCSTTVWASESGANAQEAVTALEKALEAELTTKMRTALNAEGAIHKVDSTYTEAQALVGGVVEGDGYYARKTFAAGQPILLQQNGDTLAFYTFWSTSNQKPEVAAYIADSFTSTDVPIKMTIVVSLEQAK